MVAADTNVLIRFLTHDEPEQTKKAIAAMRAPAIWISKTVLLETEWVLRRAYRLSAGRVLDALRRIAGMENVELEEPHSVALALDWSAGGMDFADALHIASSEKAKEFVTFDHALVKRARNRTSIKVSAL